MINFSTLKGLSIPEGIVTQIADENGAVLWRSRETEALVWRGEKITSDTYAGETTYTGEKFILLDIYPKTNGTVSVTYGGLTKTITDTSGAEEPNAIPVFFGTFNGITDSVPTPDSGTIEITGSYTGVACGSYQTEKGVTDVWYGLTAIDHFGTATKIYSFGSISTSVVQLESVFISKSVKYIFAGAFDFCDELTSAVFENQNWITVYRDLERENVIKFGDDGFYSLDNPSQNATYLTKTYITHPWERYEQEVS